MAFEGLTPISEAEALEELQSTTRNDPTGLATHESIAAAGQAFELQAGGGGGLFVVSKRGAMLWIHAAHGGDSADDLTELGLQLIEEMARRAGCDTVGFQTARPGLVKKTTQLGYKATGWILTKKVSA